MDDLTSKKDNANEIVYELKGCSVYVVREFESSDKTILEQLINLLVDIMEKDDGEKGG